MRKKISYLFIILIIAICISGNAISLKEAYDNAQPQDGYDKWLELETGEIYSGGLLIGKILSPLNYELEGEEGLDVKIVGNGAIIDLKGEQICMSYCENRFDIEDCIILNGNIRFRGINTADEVQIPTGSVKYVTMYKPHDYGIRIQGAGDGITIERNIVVDAVNTGVDFVYTTGYLHEAIPTGTNYSASVQVGFYGYPTVTDNWSYHSPESPLVDSLSNFAFL